MEQPETWGDHICLQAIADAYGLKINIITSYPHQDSCFIGITPQTVKTHRILYLSFWAEIHYNSIYPKRCAQSGCMALHFLGPSQCPDLGLHSIIAINECNSDRTNMLLQNQIDR